MKHRYYTYITTNPAKRVLYTGMTNNLEQRVIEHYLNKGDNKTFAGRYHCYCLLFWEEYQWVHDAIAREKELKGWSRQKKIDLIKSVNPEFQLLNGEIFSEWPSREIFSRGV